MTFSEIYQARTVKLELASKTKEELFAELVGALADIYPDVDKKQVLDGLWEREEMLSTVVAPHVALPHASLRHQRETCGIFGISRKGVNYGATDDKPIHIVMMLVDSRSSSKMHLEILQEAAEIIGSPNFFTKIMACATQDEVFQIFLDIEEMQRSEPPKES